MTSSRNIAIVGAGMAGIACARTLMQAGHRVSVFEQGTSVGGRMSTDESPFGSFDHAAQYFTVRDQRFAKALATTPDVCKPWSVTTVRVLDEHGRTLAAGLPPRESHWVPAPGMQSLLDAWAKPIAGQNKIITATLVESIEPDSLDHGKWQLKTRGEGGIQQVHAGFDSVVLAIPAAQAEQLVRAPSIAKRVPSAWVDDLQAVQVAPCWTLLLSYPQASQPGFSTLGPQWNAARSTHHRIVWLARESSKPQRSRIERWTVQASAEWSREHLGDDPERVKQKLIKAFAEITGIRVEAAFAKVHRWAYAKTEVPLGKSHLWDAKTGIGLCGDWCIGHRAEDAFISGLELALSMA